MGFLSQGSTTVDLGGGYVLDYRGEQARRYMSFVARDKSNNLQWISFATNVPTDTWHHVAVVLDRDDPAGPSGRVRVYFDGELMKDEDNNLAVGGDGNSGPFRAQKDKLMRIITQGSGSSGARGTMYRERRAGLVEMSIARSAPLIDQRQDGRVARSPPLGLGGKCAGLPGRRQQPSATR